MRSSFESAVMLLVTGVTNLCMLPAIINLHRQEYVFEVRVPLTQLPSCIGSWSAPRRNPSRSF